MAVTGGGALSASGRGNGVDGELGSPKPERGWGPSCDAAVMGEGWLVTRFTEIPV